MRTPLASGIVEVEFVIGPSGATLDTRISRNTLGADMVASCVTRVIQTLRFPTSGGGTTKARYAFQFREDRPFPIPPEPEPTTATTSIKGQGDHPPPKVLRIASANNRQLEAGHVLVSLCGKKLLTPDDYFETMRLCEYGDLVVKRTDGYEKTVAFSGAKNFTNTHEVVLEGEAELREAWLRRKAAPYCVAIHEAANASPTDESAVKHTAEVFNGEAKVVEDAVPYLRECDADALKVLQQLAGRYANQLRGREKNPEQWVDLHTCMQKDPFDPSRCQPVTAVNIGFPNAFESYVKALPNPEFFAKKAEQLQAKQQERELQALAKKIRGYFKHCADVFEQVKKASNGMRKCKYTGCTAQEQGRHQLALEEGAQYLESGEEGAPQWLAATIAGLTKADNEDSSTPLDERKDKLARDLRREALAGGCLLPY